jgi:hypothetical protein
LLADAVIELLVLTDMMLSTSGGRVRYTVEGETLVIAFGKEDLVFFLLLV